MRTLPSGGITPVSVHRLCRSTKPLRDLRISTSTNRSPRFARFAGIEGQGLEGRRPRRKEDGLARAKSDPDTALPVLQQSGDSIFREAIRVGWIVAITNEPRVLAIKAQQTVRQGCPPHRLPCRSFPSIWITPVSGRPGRSGAKQVPGSPGPR